jgi:flagellar biogenesis protein FliO
LTIAGAWLAAMPVAVAAQSRAAHLGGSEGTIGVSLGRIVISLVICIIIAALAILLIRQRGGQVDLAAIFSKIEPRTREIQVVETRRLNPHADICLVRQGGREYLLVLQQGNIAVLRDQPAGPQAHDTSCD